MRNSRLLPILAALFASGTALLASGFAPIPAVSLLAASGLVIFLISSGPVGGLLERPVAWVATPWLPLFTLTGQTNGSCVSPLGMYQLPGGVGRLFGLPAAHVALLIQNSLILAGVLYFATLAWPRRALPSCSSSSCTAASTSSSVLLRTGGDYLGAAETTPGLVEERLCWPDRIYGEKLFNWLAPENRIWLRRPLPDNPASTQ